jgi:anti-sigma regulatory factor (Ser/Thr protein kinase)
MSAGKRESVAGQAIDSIPQLRLTVPAEAANVALVRHALAGVAESLGMDPAGIADLKTVVTEACMNAVVHAYPDTPGPIDVEAEPVADALVVRIVDHGVGFQPRPDVDSPGSSLRLGLSLIAALSSSFSISGRVGAGTEVEMAVPLRHPGPAPRIRDDDVEVEPAPVGVSITASDSGLLPGVLSRAVSAFAVRRDLTVDRVSDAMLLAEAVSDFSADAFTGEQPSFSLADGGAGIELTVGPLAAGAGDRLRSDLELPEAGGSVEALADSVAVEQRDDGEYLAFRIEAGA